MPKRSVTVIAGFKNNPLACEGIVGDGCGGGRWFFVQDEKLFAYDPMSGEKLLLLEGVIGAISILKSACLLTIKLDDGTLVFDISKMVVLH